MKVRIVSDVHVEINSNFVLERLDDDDDTILLVAGDFCPISDAELVKKLIRVWSDQFKTIIVVFGNHEYYNGSIVNSVQVFREILNDLNITNVKVLDRDTYEEDNVLFVGATLWTDYEKGDPTVMFKAGSMMTDYAVISSGSEQTPYKRKIMCDEIMEKHIHDRDWIFKTLEDNKGNHRYTVVITHHGPTWLSIGAKFKNNHLNGAFVSDLSEQILDTTPNLWIHGHTHDNCNYIIGQTRVIVNPHGYRNENPHFNNRLMINI